MPEETKRSKALEAIRPMYLLVGQSMDTPEGMSDSELFTLMDVFGFRYAADEWVRA
jgi:hypothetical protein